MAILASVNNIQKFTNLETSSWFKLAEHYAGLAGRLTHQAADAALKAVVAGPGVTLLVT